MAKGEQWEKKTSATAKRQSRQVKTSEETEPFSRPLEAESLQWELQPAEKEKGEPANDQQESTDGPSEKETEEVFSRAEVKKRRAVLSDHLTRRVNEHLKEGYPLKSRHVTHTREEKLPDGTIGPGRPVKYLKREKHPEREDPAQLLEKFLGHPPTTANMAAIASAVGGADDLIAKEQILDGLADGNFDAFFEALTEFGPRLLLDPDLNALVEGWWLEAVDKRPVSEGQKRIHLDFQEGNPLYPFCKALCRVGRGRYEEFSEEEATRRTKENKDRSKRETRAEQYEEKITEHFQEIKKRFLHEAKGIQDQKEIIQRASEVMEKFGNRGKSKKAALEKFEEWLKEYLQSH